MPSIFSKIINREIPAYILAENDKFVAFLDAFPVAKGHTLIVPKEEIDYIFDLDDSLYQELWAFAKDISKRLEKAVPCERIGVSVIGLEVPHTHVHLIPIKSMRDMDFSQKIKLDEKEMISIQQSIIRELKG